MKRANATVPRWDGDKWTYRPSVDGKQKKYISKKEGKAGYDECIRKANAARVDAPRSRLESVWTDYLTERKERLGKRSDGYRKAECFGRLYILPRLKHKRIYEITSQDWQNVLNKSKKINGEPLSKKSLMNIRGEITAFCKFAMKAGLIEKMPFDLNVPKTAQYVGKNILQPDDVRLFLNDESDEWWLYCWQLQLVTGLRPGEALGLQLNDVRDGLITVRRSINSRNEITQGKNKNAVRTIVQSDLAAEIINKQIKRLSANGIDLPWLFPDKDGFMAKPMTVSAHFKKYSKKFSVSVTQYCLRHTFVSMVQNTLPPGMIKDYIGHSESMDTLGVYGHKVADQVHQTATIITHVFKQFSTQTSTEKKENAQDLTVSSVSVGAANGT